MERENSEYDVNGNAQRAKECSPQELSFLLLLLLLLFFYIFYNTVVGYHSLVWLQRLDKQANGQTGIYQGN